MSNSLMPNPLTLLSVNLIYLDMNGTCIRLEDIVKKNEYLKIKNFEDIQAFREILGGIELITSGHYVFYQSYEIYDLESAVWFLMETLDNEVVNNESKLFNSDYSYLEVQQNADLTSISYKPNPEIKTNRRNVFYFDELHIEKKYWNTACKIALEEYFQMMNMYCNEDCLKDSYINKLIELGTLLITKNPKGSNVYR